MQDYSSGVRGEKITLGQVTLNLAEYVEESEMGPGGEGGVIRRYLMQESKINSTLKIGIMMITRKFQNQNCTCISSFHT